MVRQYSQEVDVTELGFSFNFGSREDMNTSDTRHGLFVKGVLREIGISKEAIPWFCDVENVNRHRRSDLGIERNT